MSNAEESNLEIILRVFHKELYEALAFDVGLRSVLGLLMRGGLGMAMGPIGYILPDLATFATKVGYKSWQEIKATNVAGTSYDVHTTQSGLLIAENTKRSTLQDMPILLPEYFEAPVEKILKPEPILIQKSMDVQSLLRQIDGYEVIKPLNRYHFQSQFYTCSECNRWIPLLGSSETGHAVHCSRNPNRATEWCAECKTDLTKGKHKTTCSRSPVQTCSECGNIIRKQSFYELFDSDLGLSGFSTSRRYSYLDQGISPIRSIDWMQSQYFSEPDPFDIALWRMKRQRLSLQSPKPSESLRKLFPDTYRGSMGHDNYCSKNPVRYLLWCDECKTDLSPPLDISRWALPNEQYEAYIDEFLKWLNDKLIQLFGFEQLYSNEEIWQPASFVDLWHQSSCSRNPFREDNLCLRDLVRCDVCDQDLILGDHKLTCTKR